MARRALFWRLEPAAPPTHLQPSAGFSIATDLVVFVVAAALAVAELVAAIITPPI